MRLQHQQLLLIWLALLAAAADAACPVPAGASARFIDPATPAEACTKRMCAGAFDTCCPATRSGAARALSACGRVRPEDETDLVLVFSDEFETPGRDFRGGQAGDSRWTAQDQYYSSDYKEAQVYKPEQVSVAGGALHIEIADRKDTAVLHAVDGEKLVLGNYTSGMLSSWNKFCFTGGFVEFSVRLPGNDRDSGLWAATWLNGNLGRAGYLASTRGTWPYSYNTCDDAAKQVPWSTQPGQRESACDGGQGRGAPEIDVLEYGIFRSPQGVTAPMYVHTLQMGPVAPPYTSWLREPPDGGPLVPGPGVLLPGAAGSTGTFVPRSLGALTKRGFPRTGSELSDAYTASSLLGPSHFGRFVKFAVLWEPGRFVRWFLDDELLFEINSDALKATSNKEGQRVGERLIPKEALYLIMNLAMANETWSRISDSLQLPAVMSVEHVRVWQRRDAVNVGCDPPGLPTSQWISCNRQQFFGSSELTDWSLPACKAITSRTNRFLLSLCIAVGVVVVSCAAMLWMMALQLNKAARERGLLTHEEAAAAATPPEKRAAGCYVHGTGPQLVELLRNTRPDLLAAARASGGTAPG